MLNKLKIFIFVLIILMPSASWSQISMDEAKEISYPFNDTDTGGSAFETINLVPVTGTDFNIDADGVGGGGSVLCESGLDTTPSNSLSTGISSKLMTCISNIINSVALNFITNVSDNIGNTLNAVLMIGFIFYVIRIIFGAQYAFAGPTMVFVSKYIFVVFLATSPIILNDFRQAFFNTSVGLGYIMTEEVLDRTDYRCKTVATYNETAGQFAIFEFFDCIILDFIGYRVGIPASCTDTVGLDYTPDWPRIACDAGDTTNVAAEPDQFRLLGLSLVIAGLFFTGPIGAAIIVLAISLIFSIVIALVQSMLLYVTSLFAVTTLFALAPIMAPFLLFEQTKSIFRQWWQHIIVYSLQPVVLVAFLSILLSVLADLSTLMQDFYTDANDQVENASLKSECVLFTFPEIVSYDKSNWVGTDILAYDNKITAVESGFGSIADWLSGAWNTVTNAVTGVVTKIAKTVENYLLQKMGIDSLRVFCLKWHSGEVNLLFANLFAGFLLLMLCISFIRRIPDLIDKLVAPSIVAKISQFGTSDASSMGKSVLNAIAARSSLGTNTSVSKRFSQPFVRR